jgi:hypothetical protein
MLSGNPSAFKSLQLFRIRSWAQIFFSLFSRLDTAVPLVWILVLVDVL